MSATEFAMVYDENSGQYIPMTMGEASTVVNTAVVPNSSSWNDMVKTLAQTALSTYQQKELAKINLVRTQQGQPPIDSNAIAPAVQVRTSPEIESQITDSLTVIKKVALYGLPALGLLYVLTSRKGRR